MAVITQINEGRWGSKSGSRMFFGTKLPPGIAYVELMRTHHNLYDLELRWMTTNAEEHSMPFEQTDECVNAALVAMKLTC